MNDHVIGFHPQYNHLNSLQCRRILGGRKLLVYVRIVVASIFDFMIEEDWGEEKWQPLAKTFARPKKSHALLATI